LDFGIFADCWIGYRDSLVRFFNANYTYSVGGADCAMCREMLSIRELANAARVEDSFQTYARDAHFETTVRVRQYYSPGGKVLRLAKISAFPIAHEVVAACRRRSALDIRDRSAARLGASTIAR
jgi:hypothetical protein